MCVVGLDAAQRQLLRGSVYAHHVRWSLLVECRGLIGALSRRVIAVSDARAS
jgi:hypothetical protein